MTGSTLLMVSSLTVVLFTVVQATSSILQGVRKQRIPMYTLVAGVVCKIALNYTLVGIPGFNIHARRFRRWCATRYRSFRISITS